MVNYVWAFSQSESGKYFEWLKEFWVSDRRSSLRQKFSAVWKSAYTEYSRACSFQQIQKRIFDPRFARFRGRKERETLVTFRKPIQYDGLLINDVFPTVWRIIRWHCAELNFEVGNLNSDDRVEHKQIVKEAR